MRWLVSLNLESPGRKNLTEEMSGAERPVGMSVRQYLYRQLI